MAEIIVDNEKVYDVLLDTLQAAYSLMRVRNGGYAIRCEAANGGRIIGSSGGMVQNATISAGGELYLVSGGIGFQNKLEANGNETVSSGCEETSAFVCGGILTLLPGGAAYSAGVSNGGKMLIDEGTSYDGIIGNQGTIDVSSGGKARLTVVSNGGLLTVSDGGYSYAAVVSDGGAAAVENGGSANSTCVSSGGTCRVRNGAKVSNTVVSSVGIVEVSNGGMLLRSTTVSGGSVLAEGSIALGDKDKLQIADGGLFSVSELQITAGGSAAIDAKSTLRFQNVVKAETGAFTFEGLSDYDPQSGVYRRVFDCTDTTSPWTEEDYRQLLGCATETFGSKFLYRDGDLYTAGRARVSGTETVEGESFATISAAIETSPTGLIIEDGVYAADSNAPIFSGYATDIQGGTFKTSVCGGLYMTDVGEKSVTGSISLNIGSGTCEKSAFAGDRVAGSGYTKLTRTGNIDLTISGGEFRNALAGGLAFTSTGNMSGATIDGNVNLTVKGGTFNDVSKCWIYGGCLASSKTLCAKTTITGDVTVTLDATENAVSIANLAAGSYGCGKIKGDIRLVLTGDKGIGVSGEIWGGCTGDYYSILTDGTRLYEHLGSSETTDRILSFTGFQGYLNCNKIRAFSKVTVESGSKIALSNTVNLSDVNAWDFNVGGGKFAGDSAHACNFTNDFTGDTLTFSGLEDGFTSEVLFENVGAKALAGFAKVKDGDVWTKGFFSVTLFGYDAAWNPESNAYRTNLNSYGAVNYKLYLNEAGTSLIVGIA